MRNLTSAPKPVLPSLLFCSALGVWGLPGCSAKVPEGYVSMGGDTGGSTAAPDTSQSTGGSAVVGGAGAVQSSSQTAGMGPTVGGATVINQTTATVDPSLLSTGDNNAIRTGGYWWTLTDHNSATSDYHAIIDPVTSEVDALQPVVDSDPNHGNVIEVFGNVPAALPWTLVAPQDPSTIDRYWKAIYPDSMIWDYPAASVGFGFQHYNAPFDATGGGNWVGIAFDMKVRKDTPVVWVSMPMVGTDLPDPNYADAFPKQCEYFTSDNTPANGGQSCFTHYRKGIFSSNSIAGAPMSDNELASLGTWHRYCVLYSDVGIPNWANAATRDMLPSFDPTRLTKVQWDMYQQSEGNTNLYGLFGIMLDNVSLVTAAQAQDPTNNCNVSRIGAPPGTGDAG